MEQDTEPADTRGKFNTCEVSWLLQSGLGRLGLSQTCINRALLGDDGDRAELDGEL